MHGKLSQVKSLVSGFKKSLLFWPLLLHACIRMGDMEWAHEHGMRTWNRNMDMEFR